MNFQLPPNIAFFDSGQGGLTVWEVVARHFTNLNMIYLGDNARCPYGNKSQETIIRYTSEAALFLSNLNAKLMVIACGTASSVAAHTLKKLFKLPIISMVEALWQHMQELQISRDRTIAILGTPFTIMCGRFEETIRTIGFSQVWTKPCPLFVPFVEEGLIEGPLVEDMVQMTLAQIPKDVKAVVLGCTHYPRLAKCMAKVLGKILQRPVVFQDNIFNDYGSEDPVILVDYSSSFIAFINEFIENYSEKNQLYQGYRRIYCTDSPQQFSKVAQMFITESLPEAVLVEKLV